MYMVWGQIYKIYNKKTTEISSESNSFFFKLPLIYKTLQFLISFFMAPCCQLVSWAWLVTYAAALIMRLLTSVCALPMVCHTLTHDRSWRYLCSYPVHVHYNTHVAYMYTDCRLFGRLLILFAFDTDHVESPPWLKLSRLAALLYTHLLPTTRRSSRQISRTYTRHHRARVS